ncbi:MAG: dTDP-glucose 4,6-dehydratase [Planctomycetota bacterium]|nr:dTDP-glucose 4,6-dehydratase [Planctomycetota bacterium]RLT17162.1 MAG: dTDP-glucose 4,6-dehydratase [Planctomycetota bacterium]
MKRVIVTGGCGFIGSNFIRLFLQQEPNLHIVNVDNLTYAGNLENLKDLETNPRLSFARLDITQLDELEPLFREPLDSVIHFAAESHVDRSILDSGPFIRTNVQGTQILLDLAKKASVRKFVHVSTDEVYGSLGASGFFTETTPLAPNSPYSASKAASDMLVRSYFHTFGFPGVITRCSNNYGPYQFPEKIIPLFISNLLEDLQVPVYGDGLQIRDWIHVTDHCSGVYAAWKSGIAGEVYNFGGRCELTNMELTTTLLRLLDKPKSLIKYVQDRLGHDRRYAIDCAKAETELGWKPLVSFETGIAETIRWYQENWEWVSRVRSGAYREYYQQQYGSRL